MTRGNEGYAPPIEGSLHAVGGETIGRVNVYRHPLISAAFAAATGAGIVAAIIAFDLDRPLRWLPWLFFVIVGIWCFADGQIAMNKSIELFRELLFTSFPDAKLIPSQEADSSRKTVDDS